MKKSALVLVLALPALFAWRSPSDFPPYVRKTLFAKNDLRGKKLKNLSFGKAVKGKIPSAQDLKGKVLLIDFWATWCGPCIAAIPEVNEWKKKFGKDLVVVGISNEKYETVMNFVSGTKMDYVVTSDPSQKIYNQAGVTGIPHVLVLSKDGVVRYQGFPMFDEDPLTTEKLAKIIKANKALK